MDQLPPTEPGTPDQRRLRERVLAALDELYCPVAPHDELGPFLEGAHGEPVALWGCPAFPEGRLSGAGR
jgi:hypothetical protein